MTRKENPLIGKTLVGIDVAKDRMSLRFNVSEGDPVIALCDADCCSLTWVEGVELPALGFPALVTAVDDLELPQDDKPTKYQESTDVVAYYGLKISTDRGEIVIDYRNDSNGYYGGSLSWPDEYFYGGVYKQNVSKAEWEPVSATSC